MPHTDPQTLSSRPTTELLKHWPLFVKEQSKAPNRARLCFFYQAISCLTKVANREPDSLKILLTQQKVQTQSLSRTIWDKIKTAFTQACHPGPAVAVCL